MAFFIGNSFCQLCQKNEQTLKKELLFCSEGFKKKGILNPLKFYNSARLPKSGKIWIIKNSNKIDSIINNSNNLTHLDSIHCLNIDDFENSNHNLNIFEVKLHLELYKLRPDVNAISHTSSPFTLSSFMNMNKLENLHGEASLILGDIPVIELDRKNLYDNKTKISDKKIIEVVTRSSLGEPLRPIRTIIILPKYGVISLGACIHESRAFIEILEEWARFNVYSKALSGNNTKIHILSLEQLRSLGARYARSIKFGGRQSLKSQK
ncbi:MAG: class II aldolase/adducin family protein [Nitrososphaeraceae archaeon]